MWQADEEDGAAAEDLEAEPNVTFDVPKGNRREEERAGGRLLTLS